MLFQAALTMLANALSAYRPDRMSVWQTARYLLYRAPQRKRGSDSVIRAFIVAVGAALFGRVSVLDHDVDLRCMVLGQQADTDLPADTLLRTLERQTADSST